jgi:hypothetical protein
MASANSALNYQPNEEPVMKKLLAIAILGLSLSGLAAANDRAGDFSWVQPSAAQPYDGQTLSGRADYPQPVPTTSNDEGVVSIPIETNGRA